MDDVGFCAMYGIEGYFEFFKKVWSKVMPFLYSVVPCILLVLLNIVIISGLSRSNRIRQHIAEGDKKTKKETATQTKQVTLMLLSISILFLITNIPYAIFHVFGNIGGCGAI
ncbi:uncharacterized protein LOC112557309 isoform X2 [Pomacea canaliculata]|uniref:uncharacterized protein LOC112557309 isoform X2 n=1 Tax=Pomacea canaliculata TaxID=400727 RepID=UPI000D72EA6C|nr:uncharacterized protein LOC112557309 isoform X2 [Pomacea canaliculata]